MPECSGDPIIGRLATPHRPRSSGIGEHVDAVAILTMVIPNVAIGPVRRARQYGPQVPRDDRDSHQAGSN